MARPIQLAASLRRLPPRAAAMLRRLWFISAMPATWLNWAIWATIWVLSIGLNGSWVVSWVVISRRKSLWSIMPAEPTLAVEAPGLAVPAREGIVVIGQASRCRG